VAENITPSGAEFVDRSLEHVKSTNFGDLHYRDPFNTSRIELNDLCTSQGLDNLDQVVRTQQRTLLGYV
jgi:hypothetical protein